MGNRALYLKALDYIDPKGLSYEEWLSVGFALHSEGFGPEVWEDWSARDPARYKPGECREKYRTFKKGGSVTGGTIIYLARRFGFEEASEPRGQPGGLYGQITQTAARGQPGGLYGQMSLSKSGAGHVAGRKAEKPGAVEFGEPAEDLPGPGQLAAYVRALFGDDDIVSFVTSSSWKSPDGRWIPGEGEVLRAAELISSIEHHPGDIGASVGDSPAGCGGFIRINPVMPECDGKRVRDSDIKKFNHVLVESDRISPEEQLNAVKSLGLPCAAIVSSGNKSIHAIVKISAGEDAALYAKRVAFLFDYLEKNGFPVDRANKNPSRLSRMPGVMRNGKMQRLIALNTGALSWDEWFLNASDDGDGLPPMTPLAQVCRNPPALRPELIEGVLRQGHKMLLAGPSKAAKSYALIELSAAIASGGEWMGFKCREGKVLYVNLEIDPASCADRFINVLGALEERGEELRDAEEKIVIWNLRGRAEPLDSLAGKLADRIKGKNFAAVILDPVYKLLTGDENSASDMGYFCNFFDVIAEKTGASVIYCHHHSKGSQGQKNMIDRNSGSGVFGRDPDAVLDLLQLEQLKRGERVGDENATAWRLEGALREFPAFRPRNVWWRWPLHEVVIDGGLNGLAPKGTWEAGRQKNRKGKTREEAEEEFRFAYDALSFPGMEGVSVDDMADFLGMERNSVYRKVKKMRGEFFILNGKIYRGQAESDIEEGADNSD